MEHRFHDPQLAEMARVAAELGAVMNLDPNFSNKANHGSCLLSVAETNLTVPTQSQTLYTPGGTSGGKIEEINAQAIHTTLLPITLQGLIYIFIFDGTNYRMWNTMQVDASPNTSTTTAPWRVKVPLVPTNLWLNNGESLKASISVAPTAGQICVHAFGADF